MKSKIENLREIHLMLLEGIQKGRLKSDMMKGVLIEAENRIKKYEESIKKDN